MKSLSVSLLTTLAGYSVMLIVPMPILRQMALFCIAGLSSAFCFVILLGPTVAKPRPLPSATDRWGTFLGQALPFSQAKALAVTTLFICAAIPGWFQLKTGDELRLLNNIPTAVLAEQQSVSEKISPTSPGQFFVIRAQTTDEVLHRLSTLRPQLDRLVKKGLLTGYRTVKALCCRSSVRRLTVNSSKPSTSKSDDWLNKNSVPALKCRPQPSHAL